MSTTHIFTSCTNNYLPLARVLAKSLKKFHPSFHFHLVLCDRVYESFDLENEDFDNVITIEDLDIPDLTRWLFKHSVVELCTAVKGLVFEYIIKHYDCDNVIFFDPDIAIFSPLDELIDNFNDSNILITPHQLQPERISSAIIDNEICFLRHGTFNLGFLGVKNSPEGMAFIHWWANRCLDFCYSDTALGLYTDQRWIDLVPSFFSGVNILRHPGYNVANWNLSNRNVEGNLPNELFVDGERLCFYHFSSSQTIMPEKYNLHNKTTSSLIEWYRKQCEIMGQKELGKLSCVYNYFDNGSVIKDEQRLVYRQRKDLQEAFTNPFDTKTSNSYYQWWSHYETEEKPQNREVIQKQLSQSQELIRAMESSKFWKMRSFWFDFKKVLGFER